MVIAGRDTLFTSLILNTKFMICTNSLLPSYGQCTGKPKSLLNGTWDVQMTSHILPLNQFFNIKSIKTMKNLESLTIGATIHSVQKKADYSEPSAPKVHIVKTIKEDDSTGDINIEAIYSPNENSPCAGTSKFSIRRVCRKLAVQEDAGLIISTVAKPCADYHRGHIATYLKHLKSQVTDAQAMLDHEAAKWKEGKK